MIDNMKLLDALLNTRQLKLLRYIEASNGEYVPLEKFADIINASRPLAKHHLMELVKRGIVVFNPISKTYSISDFIVQSGHPVCKYCGTTVDDVNNELCYECEFGATK
ncbi:MAG: transcriptional regulator [Spartobacteria bacterium]|nr:transcriptional regulator [Spartobacteria bacterium]